MAAVCIYAPFVRQAESGAGVRVATVVGTSPPARPTPETAAREARAAVDDGADEIDVVLPYERSAAGDGTAALKMVTATPASSAGAILKMILETGRIGVPSRSAPAAPA